VRRRWEAMMSQLKRTRYLKDNCALASGRRSRIIHENDLCSVWQSHLYLPLKSHNHPTPSSPHMLTHTHKVSLDIQIHDVAHSSYYSLSICFSYPMCPFPQKKSVQYRPKCQICCFGTVSVKYIILVSVI